MQELLNDPEYRMWCAASDQEAHDKMDRMSDEEIEKVFGPTVVEVPEHPVFVYGSLKRGFGNHDCLSDAKFVGNAVTENSEYVMHSYGAFPAVSEAKNGVAYYVAGELYLVTRSIFEVLDRLEGNGHFYTRKLVNVLTDNGQTMRAWMYLVPATENIYLNNPNIVAKRRVLTDEASALQTWVQ